MQLVLNVCNDTYFSYLSGYHQTDCVLDIRATGSAVMEVDKGLADHLKAKNQDHLLTYWDNLDPKQQAQLKKEIEAIDLTELEGMAEISIDLFRRTICVLCLHIIIYCALQSTSNDAKRRTLLNGYHANIEFMHTKISPASPITLFL